MADGPSNLGVDLKTAARATGSKRLRALKRPRLNLKLFERRLEPRNAICYNSACKQVGWSKGAVLLGQLRSRLTHARTLAPLPCMA